MLVNQYNSLLEISNKIYKIIMMVMVYQVNKFLLVSVMVGIYIMVDNMLGVWYVFVNCNIDVVIELFVSINDDFQVLFNVDVLLGKFINVICFFYGWGFVMVWGVCIMDGNSFDWRYINVCCLMIMFEQLVVNVVFFLVFEFNDFFIWLMCELMIFNFLYNLWLEGVLQGFFLVDVYFVLVGLGKIMMFIDIFNGIMCVQVKVVVVWLVEFIIIIYE